MKHIRDAVILLAGAGSRLRTGEKNGLKPLMPVLDRPLISYILDALAGAGIQTIYAVVGFERETMTAQITPLVPQRVQLRFIHNPEWQKQNGISVLAAAPYLSRPFLLTMSDHLFDVSILKTLLNASADAGLLYLAVDRKIGAIFDLEDAMKVETSNGEIRAIGKKLQNYDAIDTGLFACSPALFDYLKTAKRDGDCSLAAGVQQMANDHKTRVVDIGSAWWQDVDTPAMLAEAERKLSAQSGSRIFAAQHGS